MITGNTIIGNTTRRDGGGIHCYYSSPQVTGNCIADNSAQMDGGGIRCRQNCSAEISDNSIVGNEATDGNGGGIYCDSSSPTVGNNTISGNAANWDGGGIECGLNSAAVVVGNVITGNVAQHSGGGVCCWRDRSPTFARNQVVGNTAGWGGGGVTLWSQSSPTITNNTICGNRGNENGGGIYCDESTATVRNAILWGNSALSGPQIALRRNCTMSVLYSDVGGGEASVYVEAGCILNWGIGNIDDDPLFGDPGYWDDIGTPDDLSDDVWKDGDYHLKSRHGRWNPDANGGIGGWVIDDVTSPCIDTGDPASDFSQELMPNFARINMGAFGNTSEASKSGWPIPGDVNGDCSVNVLDLIWARNRLGQDVNTGDVWRADVNGDGRVNVLDLIAVRNRLGGKCQ